VIKIVNEELTQLMGSGQSKLTFASKPPTVYMMVGCRVRVKQQPVESWQKY
jgi:signal recognition particle GTPase